MSAREIGVTELMATPAGRDERGTPDALLKQCARHDVLYRVGGRCLACEGDA